MRTMTVLPALCLLAALAGADELACITSTLDDQTRVAVTVYNGGFGVVRDERAVTLPAGGRSEERRVGKECS